MRARLLILAALLLGSLAAPWASQAPDGLERVSSDLGHADVPAPASAPVEGYRLPGVSGALSTSLAGLTGVIVVLGLSLAMVGARRTAVRVSPG